MLPTNFAFLDIGTPELLLILAIVLLLFGSKKLPQLSKSVGESIKELKKGVGSGTDIKKELTSQLSETKVALDGQEKTKEA